MFLWILAVVLAGAGLHIAFMKERTVRRAGEVGLLWVLVGYCGVPIVVVSLLSLVHPHEVADALGLPPGSPFQDFVSVANLAMAVTALLTLRYRGTYLIGPAVVWAVFFAGATFIHIGVLDGPGGHGGHGGAGHGDVLAIFATHGLISVLLIVSLIASGVLQRARVDG